jgi:hypothetical protein
MPRFPTHSRGLRWRALLFLGVALITTARPARAADGPFCVGDCNDDGAVTVDELVKGVNIALGNAPLSECPALNVLEDTVITIDELIAAVNTALQGCPAGGTPALLSSEPAAEAPNVPRTAWLRLTFAAAVDAAALRGFGLACDGVAQGVDVAAIAAEALVANPVGELPAAAHCTLSWLGPGGIASIAFSTAAAGAPATVFYDRTISRQTVPFPDDLWLTADASTPNGYRLALPIPGGPLDVQGIFKAFLTETNKLDGFSPIAHFVIELSDAPDPTSLPQTAAESLDPLASIGLFDMTQGSASFGQRIPFKLQARTDTSVIGVVSHSLLIFPSIPLTPGGRYGLVVTRRALVDPTRPFDPSPFFRAVVGPPTGGEAAVITKVREIAGEVLDVVATRAIPPIPRDDVALALRLSVRTTDDIPRDLVAIREQISTDAPPAVTITSVEPDSPDSDVAAIVHGTWQAPDWRDGLYLKRDANGLPVQTRTKAVPFTLALPRAALTHPVPVTIYQHGNPGSAEAEVPSYARRSHAAAGFAVIGFTDTLNREIGSDVAAQISAIFFALVQRRKVPDYWVETTAEQLSLVRMIQGLGTLDVLPAGAPDGIPDLDVETPLTYVGISEGANNGPGLLPYAPEVRAAALVVGGARLAEVLIHQAASTFLTQLGPIFPDLTPAEIWENLALFQTIFDQQDRHNHARFIYRDPIPIDGSTQRASILLIEGLEDSMVPNNATDSLAWAIGPIPHLKPVQRVVPFLESVDGPVVANIDEHTSAAFFQYVPVGVAGIDPTPGCTVLSEVSAHEGHFCAQSAAESLHQRVVFFQTALANAAPTIINPFAQ